MLWRSTSCKPSQSISLAFSELDVNRLIDVSLVVGKCDRNHWVRGCGSCCVQAHIPIRVSSERPDRVRQKDTGPTANTGRNPVPFELFQVGGQNISCPETCLKSCACREIQV